MKVKAGNVVSAFLNFLVTAEKLKTNGQLMHLSMLICRRGGGEGHVKGEDLIKKGRPVVGTFDHHQVPGVETFLQLWTPSWEDLVTSRLSVALSGVLVTKDGGHCSHKDL